MFATERFFSRMNQHVALEMISMFGGVITLSACKSLLTTVNQYMAFQAATNITCVFALVTTVRLFPIIQRLLGMFCKVTCLQVHVFFFNINLF